MSLTAADVRAIVREELARASGGSAPEPEVLTRQQVAALLQVEEHTVTRWVKRRDLPGINLNGKWRFMRADVLRWMKEQSR